MNKLTDFYTLKNGVKVPCVGFGTWQTPDGDVARDSVKCALENGYRHVDTAAAYGNEVSVGEGIRASGVKREDIFLTTKHLISDRGDEKAIAAYMEHKSIPCTGCSYCVPCPYGVRIPEIFAWYNEWAQSGRLPEDGGVNDSQDLRRRFLASYRNKFGLRERADRCIGCKKCLVPCPQWTFKIPVEMTKIAELVSHVEKVYVAKGGTFR